MGNFFALALKYGPAFFALAQQYGPLFLELIEAAQPVVRKMVEQDVPHADKALGALTQAQNIVASIAPPEAAAAAMPRPDAAGA